PVRAGWRGGGRSPHAASPCSASFSRPLWNDSRSDNRVTELRPSDMVKLRSRVVSFSCATFLFLEALTTLHGRGERSGKPEHEPVRLCPIQRRVNRAATTT